MLDNQEACRRIHIVGGSGSGKSTLALRLAAHLSVPVYHLDGIAYEDDGAGPKRLLASRLADVREIARRPCWITEGNYLWWTDQLMYCADILVWVDLPWWIGAWRVVSRHLHQSLTGTNRHRGLWKLFLFVYGIRRYDIQKLLPNTSDPDQVTSRIATADSLKPYVSKIIHCRRRSEVDAALASILHQSGAGPYDMRGVM